MIQLRDRELDIRERLDLGRRLADVTREFDQVLCVNDRLDLARLLDAQALHLGESSVSARNVRQCEGDRFWLTRASHDPSRCEADGADAVLLSPIFATRKGAPALGPGAIETACTGSSVPVYALGGVSADSAAFCFAAGAAGVAVIGAWLATDPAPLIGALKIDRTSAFQPR
jgi:thiamine-phosphate pyrophosphorylase